ncbi:MAG: hypothetical protein ACRC20_04370 [Segniliparus sp.]|uniref:hypothetical protein n=1 Tax=Segniliparus sp. TaxID=2804064 RepID=UPI003F2FA0E3
MRELIVRGGAVVAALALLAGCGSESASDDAGPPPDPYFFSGRLTGNMHGSAAIRLVDRAIRRIDICGLVDPVAISRAIPDLRAWGYYSNTAGEHSRDFSSCRLFSSAAKPGGPDDEDDLFVAKRSDMPDLEDAKKEGDLLVAAPTSESCLAAIPLDLSDQPQAPAIDPANQAYLAVESSDASDDCGRAQAIVVAAKAESEQGLPRRDKSSPSRLALANPCGLGSFQLSRRTVEPRRRDGRAPSCSFIDFPSEHEIRITFVLVAPREQASWPARAIDGIEVRTAPAKNKRSDCRDVYAILPGPPLALAQLDGRASLDDEARVSAIRVSGTSVTAQFHTCDALARIAAFAATRSQA